VEFDIQWLLIGLPVAFVLGWAASRLDLRQQRRDQSQSPRAYFKGLNLLLNEQHDQAIDAFIEAIQDDPDTAELHFALGNLFRRRGEFERAVRVHEHLLHRGGLKAIDRDRAQHALAQDFMKAGLFDRAEAACQALMGTAFEADALADLLSLHERAHDWHAAAKVAETLGAKGEASYAVRAAHHWCEFARDAEGRQDVTSARDALAHARTLALDAPRPWLELGGLEWRAGHAQAAFDAWSTLASTHAEHLALVAAEFAQAAVACGQIQWAAQTLESLHTRNPDGRWLQALDKLQGKVQLERWQTLLQQRPAALDAAALLLSQEVSAWPAQTQASLEQAVNLANAPLQRFRCAACGFEARQYYWQCPGCLGWDSYPTQRISGL
jgi:lipopolysaccharide assembly protein B